MLAQVTVGPEGSQNILRGDSWLKREAAPGWMVEHGKATSFISAFTQTLRRCYEPSMDRETAVAQIRKACNGISVELMKINPAVSALGDKEAQDEIYRTVFELTKEVETIKKRLAKLERSDESRDL